MIDNLIAFRILYMLVTPFKETQAYKLGIIDANGNLLKKMSAMKGQEREAYDMLTRLVFNLKRLLSKLPGGETKLGSLAAAYFLVRENIDSDVDEAILESQLTKLVNNNAVLVEELIEVINFIKLFEDAPANVTGAAVATDEPVIKPRRKLLKFTKDQLNGMKDVKP